MATAFRPESSHRSVREASHPSCLPAAFGHTPRICHDRAHKRRYNPNIFASLRESHEDGQIWRHGHGPGGGGEGEGCEMLSRYKRAYEMLIRIIYLLRGADYASPAEPPVCLLRKPRSCGRDV